MTYQTTPGGHIFEALFLTLSQAVAVLPWPARQILQAIAAFKMAMSVVADVVLIDILDTFLRFAEGLFWLCGVLLIAVEVKVLRRPFSSSRQSSTEDALSESNSLLSVEDSGSVSDTNPINNRSQWCKANHMLKRG